MQNVLLIEDNEADAHLVLLSAEKYAEEQIKVWVVGGGIDALKFLSKDNPYHNVPSVSLVILDLNLPQKDGFEVLSDIRNNPNLKHLPVIVQTTSDRPDDVLKAFRLHANCFIVKRSDLNSFMKSMESLFKFWFTVNKLPVN